MCEISEPVSSATTLTTQRKLHARNHYRAYTYTLLYPVLRYENKIPISLMKKNNSKINEVFLSQSNRTWLFHMRYSYTFALAFSRVSIERNAGN